MGQQGGDLPRNSIGGLFDRLIGGGKVIGLPLLVLCAGTSGCFSGFGETTTLNSLHSLGIRKSLACAAPSPKATPVPRSKTSFKTSGWSASLSAAGRRTRVPAGAGDGGAPLRGTVKKIFCPLSAQSGLLGRPKFTKCPIYMARTSDPQICSLVLAPLGRRLGQITKLNGFHGRNHGPGNAVQNKPTEFRKAAQHYSMVGAVGIEPTTSPV